MKKAEAIGRLFDFAAAHPEGFTYLDVAKEPPVGLGWTRERFFDAARALRLFCGNDSTINLVCDPQGPRKPYVYKLVGTFDESRGWAHNRLEDVETRLLTISSVLASIVSGTDGRARDGRRARVMHRALQRAHEDLVEIDAGPPLF